MILSLVVLDFIKAIGGHPLPHSLEAWGLLWGGKAQKASSVAWCCPVLGVGRVCICLSRCLTVAAAGGVTELGKTR